jgi:hypothetical protein
LNRKQNLLKNEKARSNIAQRINTAYENINKEIPSLEKHLKKHIKRGNQFFYEIDPDKAIEWEVIF